MIASDYGAGLDAAVGADGRAVVVYAKRVSYGPLPDIFARSGP